jgi:hypothetical protein
MFRSRSNRFWCSMLLLREVRRVRAGMSSVQEERASIHAAERWEHLTFVGVFPSSW